MPDYTEVDDEDYFKIQPSDTLFLVLDKNENPPALSIDVSLLISIIFLQFLFEYSSKYFKIFQSRFQRAREYSYWTLRKNLLRVIRGFSCMLTERFWSIEKSIFVIDLVEIINILTRSVFSKDVFQIRVFSWYYSGDRFVSDQSNMNCVLIWTAKEFVRLVWSLDSWNITVGLFLKRFHLFIRKIRNSRRWRLGLRQIHRQNRKPKKKKWVYYFFLFRVNLHFHYKLFTCFSF